MRSYVTPKSATVNVNTYAFQNVKIFVYTCLSEQMPSPSDFRFTDFFCDWLLIKTCEKRAEMQCVLRLSACVRACVCEHDMHDVYEKINIILN